MAVSKEIEKRSHIIGFKEELLNARKSSENDFFTYFNEADDKEHSFIQGSWDFIHHIVSPSITYLKDPHLKACLEIGHGGGRILASASRSFKFAYGVDIHD